jgi:EAL domain-containing protein (putative c-di-GMP-specific phosphodiesterase class I)
MTSVPASRPSPTSGTCRSDGSLTQNLARDTVNQAMVTAMIKLARSLKFKVIAEQIEEASAAEVVRRIGVDFLQGYAIGRPKPLPIAA